jgi:hypothetical protein
MGDMSDPGGGCVRDGIPMNCSMAFGKSRLSRVLDIFRPRFDRWRPRGSFPNTPGTFPTSQTTLGTILRGGIEDTPLGGLLYPKPENLWRFINPTFEESIQKLSPCLKELLGPYFPGLDLDQVSIHTNGIPKAVQWFNTLKNGVGAVTWGNDIYYPPGGYNPTSNKAIADLAHEIVHVWQYSMLGKPRFAWQYGQGYIKNVIDQLPAGTRSPFSGYLYDTLATQTAEFMKWLKQVSPAIDLDRAYKEIPLEKEAYDFDTDFLRYLDEFSKATGKASPCP